MDADIVCLQEVEVELWPTFLARLEQIGYAGELQKMSRNHPVANAVLVRRSSLQIVRIESRSRVLVAVLRDAARESAPPLYLANCHLEAGATEKASATRLFQLRSLLRRVELQRAIDGAAARGRPNPLSPTAEATEAALVLAGDFNFDRSSDLYAFLAHGRPADADAAAGAASPRRQKGRVAQLEAQLEAHPLLPLRDAYRESPPPWGPALRATYRNGRLLDFVWASSTVEVVRTMYAWPLTAPDDALMTP